MNYIQITIKANEEEQEQLIGFLDELDATGFEEQPGQLLAYFDQKGFENVAVNEVLKDYSFTIDTIEEKNWNAVWESNFEPVIVGDFCAIRADFHAPINNVQHEILITPKMSFGTGHHATTHMMIEHMQHIDFSGKTVFDFGTGTGILAILAEKLEAASVLGIDNDEWSYENANENVEKNNCKHITIQLSSVLPIDKQYDVVLANINKNVILQYIDYIKKVSKKEGIILLSGLLADDKKDIEKACIESGFVLVNDKVLNNWLSLKFINKGEPIEL